jgi:hypothetical protein
LKRRIPATCFRSPRYGKRASPATNLQLPDTTSTLTLNGGASILTCSPKKLQKPLATIPKREQKERSPISIQETRSKMNFGEFFKVATDREHWLFG